jgi:dihydrolipoamide dehydrogenase
MVIFPADRVVEMQNAKKLGIDVEIRHIDFPAIMERARRLVTHDVDSIRAGIRASRDVDFFEVRAHFIDERTLQAGQDRLRGKQVFIASGARPTIPLIGGINDVPLLTNDNVFELTRLPESLIIIGGGYVSAEFAHFFAAMGSAVTILQRNVRLVPEEEPEVSELLRTKMAERMDVHVHTEAIAVSEGKDGISVVGRHIGTGERSEFAAEQVLIAAGRSSNADLLQVENAGIETDDRGYISVNEYLETNVENTWAFGDAIGRHMFRHVANREAAIVWHNFVHGHKTAMDYRAVPHAVFSNPQIASVGLTEKQARESHDVLVGVARYSDVAKGLAMMETDAFAKSIVNRQDGKILGFHIIGPYAPILIQEVIGIMANDEEVNWAYGPMRIHPALPEVVATALYNLREPEGRSRVSS